MLRVWVYAAHMGGFWARNSLNKGTSRAHSPYKDLNNGEFG